MLCSETLESHARVRISSASFFFGFFVARSRPIAAPAVFRADARATADANRSRRENGAAIRLSPLQHVPYARALLVRNLSL